MKIRSGYVSNSSSSSYVIEFKKFDSSATVNELFSLSVDELLNCINENRDEDSYVKIDTRYEDGRNELIQKLTDQLEWSDPVYKKEINKVIKKIQKSKNNFAMLEISYCDPLSRKLLKFLKDTKVVKVYLSSDDWSLLDDEKRGRW